MKKRVVVGLIAAAIIGLLAFVQVSYKQTPKYTVQQNLNAPIEIPDAGILPISEVTDTEKPVVILFYADWCTFCRRYMPEYGKIAKKYKDKYNFAIVNCDFPENAELVKKFHIIGFPSLYVSDKKLGLDFALNVAVTSDNSVMKDELDNYLTARNAILEKMSN